MTNNGGPKLRKQRHITFAVPGWETPEELLGGFSSKDLHCGNCNSVIGLVLGPDIDGRIYLTPPHREPRNHTTLPEQEKLGHFISGDRQVDSLPHDLASSPRTQCYHCGCENVLYWERLPGVQPQS